MNRNIPKTDFDEIFHLHFHAHFSILPRRQNSQILHSLKIMDKWIWNQKKNKTYFIFRIPRFLSWHPVLPCHFLANPLLSMFKAENQVWNKHAEAQLKKGRAYKKKMCTRKKLFLSENIKQSLKREISNFPQYHGKTFYSIQFQKIIFVSTYFFFISTPFFQLSLSVLISNLIFSLKCA